MSTDDKLKITGTLDIECADWTTFVLAVTYTPSGAAKHHSSIDDLVSYLSSVGGTWWAHNGGAYDFLAIAETLRRKGKKAQIDYSRSRVSRLVSSGFTLRDSFGLVPMGLERAAKIADEEAPTLPWACTCFPVRDCGGYCHISSAMSDDDLAILRRYCEHDCYVLYRVLVTLKDFASECGLAMRGTIGSTAWATAKRDLGLVDVDYPLQSWERIGEASYGGRDLITRPRVASRGAHHDISSAYGAALARASLPVGDVFELGAARAVLALDRGSPGIYECSVHIPEDTYIPPLPVRAGGRTVYPTGLVRGAWPLPELYAAIERGADVQQVHAATVWESEEVLFDELVARWFRIRRAVGKRTALGEWMRLLVNSLTGKFSEQPLRTAIRLHPDEIKVCQRRGRCSRGCTRRCGAFEPLDAWGHIWGQPFFRLGGNSRMEWAAYLRAHCRIALLEGIERSGADELCYSKTDSIWTTSRKAPGRTGQSLGAWEYQHGFSDFECRAPGTYCYRDDEGAYVVRAAGAGKLTIEEWRAGHMRRKDGARPLLSSAQRGRTLFERNDYSWTLPGGKDGKASSWYGDRLLAGSGFTYPQPLEVHHARQQRGKRERIDA